MNLDALTAEQRACVTTLHTPLVVSAGAGSGKTHALTQRIVWALTKGSGADGGAYLSGVDELLAITFTTKAAQELKTRVAEALRAEGLREQALLVDGAWISTIHGMCSRILRAHAFDAGLASGFKVLEDVQAEKIRRDALEEVLSLHADGLSEDFSLLFSEYGFFERGPFGGDSVLQMVDRLVKEACAHPMGVDSFVLPDRTLSAGDVLENTTASLKSFSVLVSEQKESSKRDEWLEKFQAFEAKTQAAGGSPSAKELLEWFADMPLPDAGFGTLAYKAKAKETKDFCGQMLGEAKRLFCQPHMEALLRVVRRACLAYEEKKALQGVLSQDDLLVKTVALFEDHPDLVAQYADKFKLVMVDEFQDTDGLQLKIIGRLSGPDASRLCVVGDPQQSIYRFRGADVSVFQGHKESLISRDPRYAIELRDNFRSHGDVLRFVDCVFGQEGVFPDYMRLTESRTQQNALPSLVERVRVFHAECGSEAGSSAQACRAEAAYIADSFAEYRDLGYKPSDLVLLLGRMANADVYAQALRLRGFACAVTGGTVFSKAPEVQAMACLARVIANPRAEDALYQLLAGDMFRLSSADLLHLVALDGGRGLETGLRWASGTNWPGMSASMRCAARVLQEACYGPKAKGLAVLMMEAFVRSGWAARLRGRGAEGHAALANILKCMRIAEDFQKESLGLASAASGFADYVLHAKEAPGVLSVQEDGFVRIMSVHASKGLEFPIVAVAEMQGRARESSCLSCERVNGSVCVSLEPGFGLMAHKGRGAFKLPGAKTRMRNPWSLDRSSECFLGAELRERQRLLYVALTRAKEGIVLALRMPGKSALREGAGGDAVFGIVRSGLFGREDIPCGETHVDFGGDAPALVVRAKASDVLRAPTFSESHAACEDGAGWEPGGLDDLSQRPADRENLGVVSYSSIQEGVRLAEKLELLGGDADALFWSELSDGLKERSGAAGFGSAFHLLARRCVCIEGGVCGIRIPDSETIHAVAVRHGLDTETRARLERALERWVRSSAARRIEGFSCVRAEMPFCVLLPGSPELVLEGAMDLFASRCKPSGENHQSAYVVDYKTGIGSAKAEEELRRIFELQAQCYAYAVLRQGFADVNVDFVCAEQPDGADGEALRIVRFKFKKGEEDGLAEAIRSLRGKAVDVVGIRRP